MPGEELTNDESTWTHAVPASEDEETFLSDSFVPRLCNAYVYEKKGGETEVTLASRYGTFARFRADNVTPDGGLVENKAAISVGSRQLPQLWDYLSILHESEGGSLDYNFFKSPVTGMGGPNSVFVSELADQATEYNIGVHIYDNDWWEELQ